MNGALNFLVGYGGNPRHTNLVNHEPFEGSPSHRSLPCCESLNQECLRERRHALH